MVSSCDIRVLVRGHLPEAAHWNACYSLIIWYLPFYIYALPQTAVKSVFCMCWKVATWCRALTSSVSRQLRSMRCRKQSSACLCSTSSDMAWPLHRSPFYTMGFLLECRLCMDRVDVCVCVFPLSENMSQLICQVFFRLSCLARTMKNSKLVPSRRCWICTILTLLIFITNICIWVN